ncbi:MAG: mandelate racemase/muconate lactonizing enzyme family protein [Halodesulfurarchaeum sp.]
MRVTAVETIVYGDDSDLTDTERDIDITTLRIHTDRGLIGLGETFPLADMETAALHGPIADHVLGRDPRDIQAIRDDLLTYFNYYGHAGAELRALSALDIACWDLAGRAAGEPIYRLLGGAAREEIPTYNTSYEREFDFMDEPVALAESLLDEGITSMKIWPFDTFSKKTRGQRISERDLQAGLEPLERIRDAVGQEMDIAVEFHGRWALTPAKKLVRAVEEYDPLWVEDVIRKGDIEAYRRLAEATDAPLCVSERLMGRYEFRQAMRTGAVDVVMPDPCFTGGISETRAIAEMAESQHLPVAPHNSGGPVLHVADAHLAAAIPNLYLMETIRDRYDGWHRNLVTEPLPVSNGTLPIPDGPGLGTEFDVSLLDHSDTEVRRTELEAA